MMNKGTHFLKTLAAVAALSVLAPVAQAATYDFSQTFAIGTVSGQFTGTDANNDGILEFAELSDLNLSYAGANGPLSFGFGDINALTFQWVTSDTGAVSFPDTGFDLYASTGVGTKMNWAAGEAAGYAASGMVMLSDQADVQLAVDTASGAALINPAAAVPEPESYLMMAMGLVAVFAAKRRKKI